MAEGKALFRLNLHKYAQGDDQDDMPRDGATSQESHDIPGAIPGV